FYRANAERFWTSSKLRLSHVYVGGLDAQARARAEGLARTLRRDGVLSSVETLPHALGPHVVGRFKALADLLAYLQSLK
ncbi:MAG: hypothetical protein GY917_18485, partial [Planctomycetaceae bacterium]|nr:hypothetical protein [Planctomycetaceae bacterium]